MKKYLFLLPFMAFALNAAAQQGLYQKDTTNHCACFQEYYNAFTTRGSMPVPDGEHNVVFSARKDSTCFCGEGKITVKDGFIVPGLLVKKTDGTYEPATKTLHPKTNSGEGENPAKFTIFSGMSASFLTDDYYIVNLFFIDFLKRKNVENATAPTPETIEGVQIPLTDMEKGVIKQAYEGLSFKTGKSTILETSFPHLNLLASMLQDKPEYKLNINGYTDNTGSAATNLALSRQRAESVKSYLVSRGVDAVRITANGFGIENPIADNKTAAGRAKNRRVEFIMVK